MNQKEKIIKYAATALAIILAIGIVLFAIVGIGTLFGITTFFNNKTGNSYKNETSFDMDDDFDENDDWDSDDDLEAQKAASYDTTNISSFFDTVTSIEIDALIYEVNILPGTSDKVQVECNNVIKDYIVEQDADGSLHLYGKGIAGTGEDALTRLADFLDGKNILNHNWNGSITIFLPENCQLKDLEIFGGTGAINLSGVVCDKLDLDLGTGALTIDQLECNDLDLDSGTGNITLTNITSHNSDIDCGTGLVAISGKLLGETDIDCGVGKLDIALENPEDDYNIEIEKGLGQLTVNGNTFNEYHYTPSGASNHLEIEGGVGDINIDFGHSF